MFVSSTPKKLRASQIFLGARNSFRQIVENGQPCGITPALPFGVASSRPKIWDAGRQNFAPEKSLACGLKNN
jgi:hypothetical protein